MQPLQYMYYNNICHYSLIAETFCLIIITCTIIFAQKCDLQIYYTSSHNYNDDPTSSVYSCYYYYIIMITIAFRLYARVIMIINSLITFVNCLLLLF